MKLSMLTHWYVLLLQQVGAQGELPQTTSIELLWATLYTDYYTGNKVGQDLLPS